MKIKNFCLLIVFSLVPALFFNACKKSEIPIVNTLPVNGITGTSTQGGGEITNNGGESVISRGVVWSASPEPTLGNHDGITMDGFGDGTFQSLLTSLTPGTGYYVRAYATNVVGTAYGQTVHFTTNIDSTMLPTVTTDSVTYIIHNSSIVFGNITSIGGTAITARGICWNTTGNPGITDNQTITPGHQGSFSDTLLGLTPATTYFVRAYATNGVGTGYGSELQFTTLGAVTGAACSGSPTVKDLNGNTYNTVQIGSQCWMRENLRVRNFNDGFPIQNITSDTFWYNDLFFSPAPARCWYQNDSASYAELYGALYNWYAVGTGKLCPPGWHVPSQPEWEILHNYLGGSNISGGSLKATTHWKSPNTGATNVSGFTALPGGRRSPYGGAFQLNEEFAAWWTSTIYIVQGGGETWFRMLHANTSELKTIPLTNSAGHSVRCIKSE